MTLAPRDDRPTEPCVDVLPERALFSEILLATGLDLDKAIGGALALLTLQLLKGLSRPSLPSEDLERYGSLVLQIIRVAPEAPWVEVEKETEVNRVVMIPESLVDTIRQHYGVDMTSLGEAGHPVPG